jgi:localization factor PodJL
VTEVPVEPEAAPEAPDEIPPFAGAPDEAVPPQDEQKIETNGEAARPAAVEDPGDYSEIMRKQAAALDGLAKRIMVPKTVLKEGTAAAISRLETRLHVVEQSVAEIETRRSHDAKELGERVASVSDPVQRFEGRLVDLEKRQQMSLAELRLELHNLTARVDGLGRASQAESEPAAVADFQPWTSPPAPESAEPEEASEEPAQPTYLASARRAAIDAAQQPVADEDAKTGKGWAYWRWLVAVVIVAAGGLGFALNMHTDDAVNASLATQLVSQVSHQPQKSSLAALAKAGSAKAQLILGLKLLNGTGMAIHIDKAAGWLERAANKGQPVAQEILGVLYQTGTGVAADMTKAIRWYETAAAAGNVKAMANLGKAYGGGSSGGTDLAKAAQWFTRAAALGDVDSAFNLAILYERGEGVPASLRDAYKWYAIAAASGDKEAASQAGIVAARLASAELQTAQKTAADFKPAPVKHAANDIPSLGPTMAMK